MKFLVMGAGGIGGIVAAGLHEAGRDVLAFTTNGAIAEAVRQNGFRLRGAERSRAVRGRITTAPPEGPFDVVVLCTQPPQVEEAAAMASRALAEGGVMICLQNGLCEARVARVVGAHRTLGAVVTWGAAMPEPGVYDRTARGGFALGSMSAASQPSLEPVARALAAVAPVELTSNLAGRRWSKLAINAAISSLGTIGGDRVGALMRHAFVRRLALEVMTEAARVARAEGVALERVSGLDLDWLALGEHEARGSASPSLAAKHALLLGVGIRYRRMRSSMLAAIERGRPPAVDFLNGEITQRAAAHGIAAGLNAAVSRAVWAIARNEMSPGTAALRSLFDASQAKR